MKSRIAIAGHPIHPMLVPIPIGLLVGSVAADLGYILTGRDATWADIAFWTLAGGLVSAVPAAAAGFGEYLLLARHTDARELATWHLFLNAGALALFVISLLLRLDEVTLAGDRFGAAFAISAVAVTVLAISGWIGGELIYRKHLGVDPDSVQQEAEEARIHLPQPH